MFGSTRNNRSRTRRDESVRPVCQAAAIEHEGDGQILQRDFLEDLIVRALQKRTVNVDDGSEANFGLASGEGDGVAFADADVEEAIGKRIADPLELVALAHGGRDHGDARIDLQLMVNRIGRDVREGPRRTAGHGERPDRHGVQTAAARGTVLDLQAARLEAVALFGNHVEQNRSLDLFDHPQVLPHEANVVAVDGAKVVEAEVLENMPPWRPAFAASLSWARNRSAGSPRSGTLLKTLTTSSFKPKYMRFMRRRSR